MIEVEIYGTFYLENICSNGDIMNSYNYKILESLLSDFSNDYILLQEQIDSNLLKIKEADYYENSFLEKEDKVYKVFSPRDAESVYKDEIQHARENKHIYEEENNILLLKQEKLSLKIEQLNKILLEEKEQDYMSLSMQEADRQRIARDLHDTSLQNLAHLVHKIELSSMYIDKDPLHAKLELSVVSKNLKSIIEEIRNTIFDLRPMTFDDLGMKAALERLIVVINENKTYEMDVEIEDVSCENNLVLVYIYRTIQECMTNIIKHAEATKIYFHCNLKNDIYHVVIRDNGKGFTKEEVEQKAGKHFGLALMKERITLIGGRIIIQSNSSGTEIKIEVPMK